MADADATWDFGTAAQGTLLKRSFTFANTGACDLLTYVSAPAGLTVSQTGSRRVGPADMTTYEMALNTANLSVGPYDGDDHHPHQRPGRAGADGACSGDGHGRAGGHAGGRDAAPAGLAGASFRHAGPVGGVHAYAGTGTRRRLHPVKVYGQDRCLRELANTPRRSGQARHPTICSATAAMASCHPAATWITTTASAWVWRGQQRKRGHPTAINVTDAYGGWRINPAIWC